MKKEVSEEESEQYYLPLILQEIERVNRIVTELLMLSKPSRPNYREVSLEEIFSSRDLRIQSQQGIGTLITITLPIHPPGLSRFFPNDRALEEVFSELFF